MAGLIACSAIAALDAKEPEIKRADFSAQITVAADGRPRIGDLTGITGPLANAVQSQLVVMRFVPARVAGAAVATTTTMSGSVALAPLDRDQYSVAFDDLSFAPGFRIAAPVSYPREMAAARRSGSVELKLRIDTDGRASFVQTVSATSPEFEKAVRDVVPALRFIPQSLGDKPVAVNVNLPVWFHGDRAETKPGFQCDWDDNRPRAERSTGCLGVIQVVYKIVVSRSGSLL